MDLNFFNLNLAGQNWSSGKPGGDQMINMVLGLLNIGTQEMLLIVFVALLLFGGKKLPELARGLGRGIREFKDASETIKRDISEQINNFEKDVDIKSVMVEDVESAVGEAQKTLAEKNESTTAAGKETAPATEKPGGEDKPENSGSEKPNAHPIFSAGPPVGTYQHQPGREPDYVGSKDVYYNNDHTPASDTPAQDPDTPAQDNDAPIKPQQSTDHS